MRNEAVRKSTLVINGTVFTDMDGSSVADLTGATIVVLFKENPKNPDSDALFQKSIGSGVTITTASAGTFQCIVTSANLDLNLKVVYFEAVVTLNDGSIIRNGISALYLVDNVKHQ